MSEYVAETNLDQLQKPSVDVEIATPKKKQEQAGGDKERRDAKVRRPSIIGPGVREDEFVDQTSESFYHTVGYFFVLKQGYSGTVYFMTLVVTLSLQLIALIGFMEAQVAQVFDENLKRIIESAYDMIGLFSHDTQTDDSYYIARAIVRLIPNSIHPEFEKLGGTNWDSITLVFVAFVISLNIMKELEESFITQDYILIKRRELPPNWANWTRAWVFLAINALRQYLLGMLLISATAIVLNGETASNLILNGLALYSILEVDNLVFWLVTTTMDIGELGENGKLHHPYSEAWLIRCRSGLMGMAYLISILIPSFVDGSEETSVTFFFDPSKWFSFADHGQTITMGSEIVDSHEKILNTALICMGVSLPASYFIAQAMYYKKFKSKWRCGKQIVRALLRMAWIVLSVTAAYFTIRQVMENILEKAEEKLTEVSEYVDKVLEAENSYCAWAYKYDADISAYESYCFCANDEVHNSSYAFCYKNSGGSIDCNWYDMPNATTIRATVGS
jgi:hypothetical protein